MSETFSFLLLTVSAQQKEEPSCGRIPPHLTCLGLMQTCTLSVPPPGTAGDSSI